MKVEGNRSVGSSALRASQRKSSDGFAARLEADETRPVAAVSGTRPVDGIHSLFALQEVGDPPDERRAMDLGAEILDRLDELRRGLLLGRIGSDRLVELARLSTRLAEQAADPRLKQILQDIELRAQVELAKLEVSRVDGDHGQ
jgi:hypothetical protein